MSLFSAAVAAAVYLKPKRFHIKKIYFSVVDRTDEKRQKTKEATQG